MASSAVNADGVVDGAEGAEDVADVAPDWSSWTNLWQIPTILVAGILIVIALRMTQQTAPENDFDGAMDQVETMIADDRFDLARGRLRDVIEPNLADATPAQRARFHALIADWLFASQRASDLDALTTNRLILDHYAKAEDLGLNPTPARLERWALAAISIDEIPAARRHLESLDAIDLSGVAGPQVRGRRNRVRRQLIEHALANPSLEFDELMRQLASYRNEDRIGPDDRLWAMARQAEARLRAARPAEAADHLLIDLRRVEAMEADGETVNPGILYALLGRAYYDLGNFPYARHNLGRALETLDEGAAAVGDVHVVQGLIDVAEGDLESASEHFDHVVTFFEGTPSFIRGLLGRADVLSRLGLHEEGLATYRRLHERILAGQGSDFVTIGRVAESLVERHDAALPGGDLDLALLYGRLAESLFAPDDVPEDLLIRLASTLRQTADNLMTSMRPGVAPSEIRPEDVDPALRAEAAERYREAAGYFVRHARAVQALPNGDRAWAESLWLAADSYDLAGRHEDAVVLFREYVGGREDDPRRAEAEFRLGQASEAVLDYGGAAEAYAQVIEDHKTSPFAYLSYVPLARCLIALDRRAEAEDVLRSVVSGERALLPDAREYRDALVELGRLHHRHGEYDAALPRLQEARDRYPDDPRISHILFLLADTHRGAARAIDERIEASAAMPRSQREQLLRRRDGHLTEAMGLFGEVIARLGVSDDEDLDALRRDMLRSAFFYRANCAFALGRFADARDHYDQAARRYRDHHSSMHALVQIYNCYAELNDVEGARNAHRRAMVRLQQLPDEAFNAPDSLMDRAAWERWLASSPVGPVAPITSASAAGTGE